MCDGLGRMHTNLRRWILQAGLMTFAAAVLSGQPIGLPELAVYAPRVALEEPVGVVTMPVSALRYEPLVDVQARNLAEGQADVSIREACLNRRGFVSEHYRCSIRKPATISRRSRFPRLFWRAPGSSLVMPMRSKAGTRGRGAWPIVGGP